MINRLFLTLNVIANGSSVTWLRRKLFSTPSQFFSKQKIAPDLAGESISICLFTYSAYKLNVLFHLHSF